MGLSRCMFGAFLVVSMVVSVVHGDPLVPALCIFGDSVVDAGNNNNLQTLIKANFPSLWERLCHPQTYRKVLQREARHGLHRYMSFWCIMRYIERNMC
ncbi:UNVERIFIED_CONTAM: GDSL esterase/lipase [Sesamum latifolium]|uniref:GDSL esterase/lipase n=1 Tax=Sesamum latifolium TaxID=2727402 RepID=A0AAW2TZM4_9LAMI